MSQIRFADPYYFLLLLLLPVLVYFHLRRGAKQFADLKFSTLEYFLSKKLSWKERFPRILFTFQMIAFVLLVLSLVRPQSHSRSESVHTEGIDVILVLDVSGSMLAEDFKPNRIEAAKTVAIDFVENRRDDRIGLVIFAGESFTQCPLTTDHAILKNLLKEAKSGLLEDGTAIGMGFATAISRLKDSKAKSKVIILLTDGVNNRGFIAPLTAAEIAKHYGIRVYTVGIGSRGYAPYPVQTPFGIQYQNMEVQIDEEVLREIAKQTSGKYFRATGNTSLKEVYNEIDKLEKTRMEVLTYKRKTEWYFVPACLSGLFLFFGILFRYTVFRTFP